jgi:integrase
VASIRRQEDSGLPDEDQGAAGDPLPQGAARNLEAVTSKQGFILTTPHLRRAYSANGLSQAFRKVFRKIGVDGYSIHGLRKNASAALAEAGCTDREIMAIIGHRTTGMVTKYTKRASQKRRAIAAIEKWENSERELAKTSQSGKPKNVRRMK